MVKVERLTAPRRNGVNVASHQLWWHRCQVRTGLFQNLSPSRFRRLFILHLNMSAGQQPSSQPPVMHQQDRFQRGAKHHPGAGDMARGERITREWVRRPVEKRQSEFPALCRLSVPVRFKIEQDRTDGGRSHHVFIMDDLYRQAPAGAFWYCFWDRSTLPHSGTLPNPEDLPYNSRETSCKTD